MSKKTKRISLKHELRLFIIALQFLTRIPVPALKNYQPAWLHQSSRYFPAVGLVVGSLSAAVFWVFHIFFNPLVAAIVSTAFGIRLTGAFHEDGLADTCDGLGGGLTRERTLSIIKDSRIGTYGTVGLLCTILVKIALLSTMPVKVAIIALIIAHSFSRFFSISLIYLLPYGGDIEHAKAKPMAQQLTLLQSIAGLCWGLAGFVAFILFTPDVAAKIKLSQWLLAIIFAILVTDYMRRLLKKRLHGYTGDGLGATQQLTEIAIYAGLAVNLPF